MSVDDKEIAAASNTISLNISKEYKTFLNELKGTIRGARLKAALAINRELIALYWHIGTLAHWQTNY